MNPFRLICTHSGDGGHLYSVCFNNCSDDDNELFKFLLATAQHDRDSEWGRLLAKRLEIMYEREGFGNQNFRDENRIANGNVVALPPKTGMARPGLSWSKCCWRLYGLHLSERLVIIGGGGYKRTRSYQEDPELFAVVQLLEYLERQLRTRCAMGIVAEAADGCLNGDLQFNLSD